MSRRRQPAPAAVPLWADLVSCVGKVPFVDKRSAKARAREIRAEFGTDMHAYRCSACLAFHLGHKAGQATGNRHADPVFITQRKEKRS